MTARRPGVWTLLVVALLGAGPAAAEAPPVTAVDLVSPDRLPEARLRGIVDDLAGRPLSRDDVRERIERLWSLGLFSWIGVESVEEPGGVRLRIQLRRRPHVRSLEIRGDTGIAAVDVVEAAALPVGADAGDDELARAARRVRARLRREGYFLARVEPRVEADDATGARAVTLEIDAGARARVGRVDIAGLERADPARVAAELGLGAGRPFRTGLIDDRVGRLERWLRDHGFPAARATAGPPAWDQESNRVNVEVRVAEGPEVRVEFEGRQALGERELRAALTFPLALAVDDTEVTSSAREMVLLYHQRGHLFATVQGSLVPRDGRLVARFVIQEGPRVLVEAVELRGDTGIAPERLAGRMATRPSNALGRPAFVPDTLDADVARLRAALRAEGYPDARVEAPEVALSDDRTRARVTVAIAAGPRLRVGTLRVTGLTVLGEAEVLAALPLRAGGPWSQAATDEGQRVVERRLAQRGRHGARVEAEVHTADGRVDVVYRVEEGPLTRIGRVLVAGLTVTREHVVLRELPFAVDDPFDPERLLEAQRRLAQLGLFERVDVQPLRPPPRPYVDVTVTLREGKPWRLDLGGGYSDYEGLRGLVVLGHDNLFGTGRSASLRGRVSQRGHREEGAYREPWLLGTRWTGDMAVFHERRDEIGYDFERIGLGAGVEREVLAERIRGLRGALRYTLYYIDRWNVDPTLDDETVIPGTELVSSITPELILDRRDRPLDPRSGSLHLLSLETGGVFLGGESNFLKARLETAWFLDWLRPTVLALGARLGLAGAVLGSRELPLEERFFAGGGTTVRGYRERRLGPLDAKDNPAGGNAQLILNAEWRFPIWGWFGGAVFVDSGAVTADVKDLAPGELKSAVGGGLLLNTPVGPIRFDVGWPLDDAPGQDRKVRYYLTVGHPF